MRSRLTRDFLACFAALPEQIQRLAKVNYILWKNNPNHSSLAFKRVGKKYAVYSVRVGLGWRALGYREDNDILWYWIGSHADYEKLISNL